MQKFNYHTHTYRCGHAEYGFSDEEYVKTFIDLGFETIAFTDHNPQKTRIDMRSNVRMNYSEINDYLSSVNALKEKYKDQIEIKSGFEIEYFPGLEIELLELKEKTDILVLGQHFVYNDSEKQLKYLWRNQFTEDDLQKYGQYIEKAILLNLPDIIVHPDIYMLGRENFGEPEERLAHLICQNALRHDIPLEINLTQAFNKVMNPDYKVSYPNAKFWEIVASYGNKVLYGVDAHYKNQILNYEKSIEMANSIIGKETIERLNFIEHAEIKKQK